MNAKEAKDHDFEKEVFPVMLVELGKKDKYFSKTRNEPNLVRIRGRSVRVMTKKSSPNYEPVPHKFFVKTWELLCRHGSVTQNELSEKHNIKRSSFMLIAFDLLNFVAYDRSKNGLKLKQTAKINKPPANAKASWRDIKNPESIVQAIHEYDELGRKEFLSRYGYGKTKDHALIYKGKPYDPKAILGVAFGYEFNRDPVPADKFTGAKARKTKLQKLGFEVVDLRDLFNFSIGG